MSKTEPCFTVEDPTDDLPFDIEGAVLTAMADPRFDAFGEGSLPKPKKERKPYDPGQPNGITKIGPGKYEVQSFRNPEDGPYIVDLGTESCTCPHHVKRAAKCKHITLAWETAGVEVWEAALGKPSEEIETLLQRPTLNPIIRAELEDALTIRREREATALPMAA
jgi:hypothetical protein